MKVSGQWSIVRSQRVRRLGYNPPTTPDYGPRTTNYWAFTLIEIMIVCAIIGIVMTMAAPAIYRRLHPESMQKAVNDVLDACREARAHAILQAVPVELVIRGEDAQISVQPVSGGDRGGVGLASSFPDEPAPAASGASLFTARISDRIAIELLEVNFQDQMEFEEARVRFYPNGTSDEFRMLLVRPETQERRLISLEVVTALADFDVIK